MKAIVSLLAVAVVSSPMALGQKTQVPLTIVGAEATSTRTAAPAAKTASPSSNPTPAAAPQPTPNSPPPAAPIVGEEHISVGSKLFIEPMNGFETYLAGAILKKKVPVVVVDDRSKADFIVSGVSDEAKAGWAKTIFVSPASHAQASISVKDAHTGNLVFAYNVDKFNAVRANQSTAEACAKHLKASIQKE